MEKIYRHDYAALTGKSLANLIKSRESYIMALRDFNQTGLLNFDDELKILHDDALQAIQED